MNKPGALMAASSYTRAVALLTQHERALGSPFGTLSVNERTALIPAAHLPLVITALQVQLLRADQHEVAQTIALIAGAWPYAHLKADAEALDLHFVQMQEDLGEFPPDILTAAVRGLRRTLKFAPSLAELFQAADELVHARRRRLHVAEAHQAEHARRDAAAQAEREEIEAKRIKFQAQLDRLTAAHGGPFKAWSTDDVEAMESGWVFTCFRFAPSLEEILDLAEPWVPAMLATFSVGGRACLAYCDRRLAAHHADRAIMLASSDFSAARQAVIDATLPPEPLSERGDPLPGGQRRRPPQAPDDGQVWEEPSRVLTDVVNGMWRQHQHERAA
jgi:hypothetical protein